MLDRHRLAWMLLSWTVETAFRQRLSPSSVNCVRRLHTVGHCKAMLSSPFSRTTCERFTITVTSFYTFNLFITFNWLSKRLQRSIEGVWGRLFEEYDIFCFFRFSKSFVAQWSMLTIWRTHRLLLESFIRKFHWTIERIWRSEAPSVPLSRWLSMTG